MRRAQRSLIALRHAAAASRAVSATSRGAGDTIFALSTPPGRAALAVVRASGPGVRSGVLRLLPRGAALPPPRTAALVRLAEGGDALDRALLLFFPAPRSATGEDVAELHLHGGPAVVQAVLAALARTPGWRPAAAGEFARRAFASGVLDLARAEGLADLLNAETAAQRRQALAAADGALARRAAAWRAAALRCLAHAEAAIDFGEDASLGDGVAAGVAPAAAALRAELAAELARSGWAPPAPGGASTAASAHITPRAELVRCGVRVALGGAPNAGKSSLLNALAGREAAIVSPRAGTTRDALPVGLELGGHKLVVTDTAGLRASAEGGVPCDDLEEEGMRRARAALAAAHVRLLVLDAAALAAAPPAEAEWGEALRAAPQQLLVVALNKADLLSPAQRAAPPAALLPPWLARRCAAAGTAAGPWLLSCASGEGLDALCAALRAAAEALLGADAEEPHAVTRARHAAAMRDAVSALDTACAAAADGADELAAEELRGAAAALGRLTGIEVGTEDVLDVIFAEFCIGK